MAKKLTEQQQAVADFLAAAGVEFSVIPRCATKRDDWGCDEWAPLFRRGSDREGRQIAHAYFTGIGHRKSERPMPPDIARLAPRILARVEWEKRHLKPVAPCAADVLYCLLSDANGADQNFNDWCADFGYDPDSRKALATYDECSKVLADVRAFFSAAEREKLAELLEGY
ncbi:hypothetical protein [Pseudomonas aeruginosa]|nr:hypothetical protein [Pseudomonas aeruginosa]MBX6192201.1 hypothetical protein [Pseudomonas aeruginosa]QKL14531.1 hypothetical protein GEV42_21660 [Pseudomonas aeruginosa]QQV97869.1 hypothetical protein HUF04_22385 [Pseudomonas aeruginosa]